jgi:hypothetical protein
LVYADLWNSKEHSLSLGWNKTDTSWHVLCLYPHLSWVQLSNTPQDSGDDKLHMKSVNGLLTQNTIRTVAGEISDSCLRLFSMESVPYTLLGFSARILEIPWHTHGEQNMRPEREETSHRFCNLVRCTVQFQFLAIEKKHYRCNTPFVKNYKWQMNCDNSSSVEGFFYHKNKMVWCHYHFLPLLPIFFGHPMGRQLSIITLVVWSSGCLTS